MFDGRIEKDIVEIAEHSKIQFLVAMDSKYQGSPRLNIVTAEDL